MSCCELNRGRGAGVGLHNFVIYSYTYGMLKAVCKSRTGVHLGKFPIVYRQLSSNGFLFNDVIACLPCRNLATDNFFQVSCHNIVILGPRNTSVLGLFHPVDVGDVANVLEVHAAFSFRVDVCRLGLAKLQIITES
jgi:hypothetical protein